MASSEGLHAVREDTRLSVKPGVDTLLPHVLNQLQVPDGGYANTNQSETLNPSPEFKASSQRKGDYSNTFM